MEVLILTFTIISILISLTAITLSLSAIIEVKALKNSTHKIEWVPVPNPFENKQEDVEDFEADPTEGLNL